MTDRDSAHHDVGHRERAVATILRHVDLRDLPWRRTRDPWLVLVSEFMAQQTQVDRVIPKWRAFVDDYPTATACADAPQADIVTHWKGLGYNRRAIHLHRAATAIRDDHDGRVPNQLSQLLDLPGVGPYTARAVLAFAFEQPAAVVDTNVGRVLARAFANRRLSATEAQRLADELVPPDDVWQWNQKVMELGATWCRPAPDCDTCPINADCAWQLSRGEDPAVGSAGVSTRQSKFEGSDRQGAGRLVDALRSGPVAKNTLAQTMGWSDDPARAARVATRLIDDGLAVVVDGEWQLA